MLRIAIWFENRLGRNDGNPLYVFAALKRMEEKGILAVNHLIPTGDVKPFGSYDFHIWVDWGEDGLKGVLPYEPFHPGHPLIYWASDTHLGYDYRLGIARRADLVFCAQKRAVEEFKKEGVTAVWLPHAVEPYAYCDEDSAVREGNKYSFKTDPKPYNLLTKKYDVCFVGHVNSPNRIEALDRLFREFPNFFYGQRLFNEAARKYSESKIVFNISMLDDLNMRVFEIIGSKSFCLTNDIPSIHDLFEDGKHLVLYKDLDDMVGKVHYYLEHDEERDKIAQAGYEEVMANHTIDQRVNVILERAKDLVLEKV